MKGKGEMSMALINCPECGQEISDKAKWCVHCGYPLQAEQLLANDIQKLLSGRDLKRILGCSTKVINDLLNTPEFPKIKIGKEYYVPQVDFEVWIKQNTKK